MKKEIGNGIIIIKLIKNQYENEKYRISVLKPNELKSCSFGTGISGSTSECIG